MRIILLLVAQCALLFGPLELCSSAHAQNGTSYAEPDLIAVLQSDSPGGDKALACKRLAIFGSKAAVPELAKLLGDDTLSSWSRIALEAIPGKESDMALRTAAATLRGRLLIGVINSIGVRRDADSVGMLITKLKGEQDVEVASACAVALGKIGGKTASDALRKSLVTSTGKLKSAIAGGCVLCAERALGEGDDATAIKIYDEVRTSDVPSQRIVEATRGAILARKQDGIPLLLEQFRSGDKKLFQVALTTVREIPGREVGVALVAELGRATPQRAALMVQALADLKGSVDLATILQVAFSGPKEVRLAAIGAIGRIGDASCVAPLLNIALENDKELLQAAKGALVDIQDEGVSKEIIAKLPTASGEMQALLINVVGLRRIEATAELIKALDHSDAKIRAAALDSLGRTVVQGRLGLLIEQVVAPKHAGDALPAQQALKMAAVRMPDREACAAELASAIPKSPTEIKTVLLEIEAVVGGAKALQTVALAAKDNDPALKDVCSRLLGDWMSIDAAPVLLDLATNGPADKFQTRAMRGYIRIARQFVMQDTDRVEMCTKALAAARQPAEQKLVVDVLKRYPSIGTLRLAIQAASTPELKEDGTQAAQAIAKKLGDNKEVVELMAKAGIAIP